ncbi:hypothetical protein FDP41_006942 [Naegleria fowleri]|uniref:Uncharacterized protein n=1 Tax=Naegleria fowleri TaxID=5763 RepID=A0A6A5BHT6_NAEFO|nr:uncharacterized protein FDP41_006942 [Naegleria fowleri]KAF0974011.1 hypothetical protein FDP41_006942 [Naegleria fowleri]
MPCHGSTKSKSAEEWIELGDKDFRNREYQQAISKYTNALEVDRENKRALLKRAETYQLMKKFIFALSDVDALLRIQSDHTQALSMKGQLALSLGLFEDAISALETLISLKPSNEATEKLRKAKLGKSLYKTLIKILTEVGARESLNLLIQRAHCALRAKLFPILTQDIKTIYAKESSNVEATILYTKYLYLLGDISNAKNTIKNKCLRVDPEHKVCKELFKLLKQAESLHEKATSDFSSGNHKQAVNSFKAYIDLMEDKDSKNILPGVDLTDTKVKLCESYSEAQDHTIADDGIKYCTTLIDSLGDENSEYKVACLMSRAQLHVLQEDFDKAKSDANRVRESEHASKYQQKIQQILGRVQQQERINSQKTTIRPLGLIERRRMKSLKMTFNILITGCSKGIGLKLVELLLSSNDQRRVFATCRNPEHATQLQNLLQLYPDRLRIDPLDVSQEETIKTYVEKMKNQVKFHILINNAGTFSPNRFETLLNATKQDMLSIYETNCIGPLLMVQHLYNNNCFENGAIVANVSSGMASINRTNRPRKRVSYCCSKTALNMLTKMMSIELEEMYMLFQFILVG